MYLGPHHFRCSPSISRLDEIRNLFVVVCSIRHRRVRTGRGCIAKWHGIDSSCARHLPDGLAFAMPERPLPPARAIADLFPPTRDSVTVLLAIRIEPGGRNCAMAAEDAASARYVATTCAIHDENTGADERSVSLGRKNLRLLLDTESADGLTTLPIARVMRDGSGRFVFDQALFRPASKSAPANR